MTTWTLLEARDLCISIEAICPPFGCHVALTGGLLYKGDPRKDLDILFYRIRQTPEIDFHGLMVALATIGIKTPPNVGQWWCVKATFNGKPIDMFFPESDDSGPTYGPPPPPDVAIPGDEPFDDSL